MSDVSQPMMYRAWKASVAGVMACLALGIGGYYGLLFAVGSFRPETAAIERERPIESLRDGIQISFYQPTEHAFHSFEALRSRGQQVVLWLGGSHLHTDTDYKPGDQVAGFFAAERAAERGTSYTYLQHSLPNMNLNEALYLYLAYRQRGLRPVAMVVGVVYDDLDDFNAIRAELQTLPVQIEPGWEARYGAGITNIRAALLGERESYSRPSTPNMTAFSENSAFLEMETRLTEATGALWPDFSERNRIQAWLQYKLATAAQELFITLRSWARDGRNTSRIRITARSPIREQFKQWNLNALESLAAVLRDDRIPLFLYKAPNPQVTPDIGEFKYDRGDFDAFFSALQSQVNSDSGLFYADLENALPQDSWFIPRYAGTDIDFFHFNGSGHRLLGIAVDSFVQVRL